jgi:hypothetical protein
LYKFVISLTAIDHSTKFEASVKQKLQLWRNISMNLYKQMANRPRRTDTGIYWQIKPVVLLGAFLVATVTAQVPGYYIQGDGSGGGGGGASSSNAGSTGGGNGGNGGGSSTTISGTAGNDVIFGDGSGGGAGARTISYIANNNKGGLGGGGNDTILGGGGDDIIFGDGFDGIDYGGWPATAGGPVVVDKIVEHLHLHSSLDLVILVAVTVLQVEIVRHQQLL